MLRAFVADRLLPLKRSPRPAAAHGPQGEDAPRPPRRTRAQAAVTDYETLRIWRFGGEKVSLVEARPITGRHHQIRVHLRSAEAPILFDPLYGRGHAAPRARGRPCQRLRSARPASSSVPAPSGGGRGW